MVTMIDDLSVKRLIIHYLNENGGSFRIVLRRSDGRFCTLRGNDSSKAKNKAHDEPAIRLLF